MSIPLCRQVIQVWMDIYPFRLANEASISGRVIAQHWQLRKPASSGTSFSMPASWFESTRGWSSRTNGLQWDFLRRGRYLLYWGLAGPKIVNLLAGPSFGYRQPLQFHNSQSVGRGAGPRSEL